MSGIRDAASPSRDGSEDSGQATEDSRPANNLPLALTSFVGREREMAEVMGLLEADRLLTLTGPGGSGKTRLALAVAAGTARNFEDGVWLVELASLSDPDLVPQAVASVLGVRETPGTPLVDALVAHLEPRNVLLILDNCEHLVDACASLAGALLRQSAGLSILATSREAFGVTGETLFAVPPLSLPDPRRPPNPGGLSDYEAARLFAERARSARHDFSLTAQENAWAVAQICHRLDGIPLAIELAAAKTRALSVRQISERLKESFSLLSGGGRATSAHHGTLLATMDWSHGLLSEEEKVLFRRLSVFAGGWTLEAAEAVCVGGDVGRGEVLDLLAHLVDKSLVAVGERDGDARYGMLETLRQYASEKLGEASESGGTRARHAAWFLALAERAEPELKGRRQPEWLASLETEHDNLRAAMRFLLDEGETQRAVRLAWALWLFWYLRGHQGEGYRYMGEALQRGDDLPAIARAKALDVRGMMSHGLGSVEEMERLFQEAAALFRRAGDEFGLAMALSGVGVAALQRGDVERANALLEESLSLHLKAGRRFDAGNVLVYLGMVPLSAGDHDLAARRFEEALAISRETGDRLSGYTSLYGLALSSRALGDDERARRLYAEGLGLAVEAGDGANAAYCLEALAGLIAEGGGPERAARLFGASEVLLENAGAPRYAHLQDRALVEGAVEGLRVRLGEATFGAAWAEGREMPLEGAVGYALEGPETPEAGRETGEAPPELPAGLSTREVEVLRLAAQGMTNAQVARELFISPRTVNAHLGSIYNKIGSSTRAEAARFASENRLI